MVARIHTLFFVFLFALCVSASVVPRTDHDGGSSDGCNADTGSQQCCDQLQDAKNPVVGVVAGLLGVVIDALTGQVGLTCSPIVGGAECNSQAVCCNGDNFNGLLVLGCSPLNINL
ncbi:hypothetical protein H2248_012011 [Termitomyces sp. 'cryptogamus']|nr:hypothetical protein H2248_012011 [Termitomyces sp. 'cryptogamus']